MDSTSPTPASTVGSTIDLFVRFAVTLVEKFFPPKPGFADDRRTFAAEGGRTRHFHGAPGRRGTVERAAAGRGHPW